MNAPPPFLTDPIAAREINSRRSLAIEDLLRLDEPAVIFETSGLDSDGVPFWVYTVAGWLDGENVATIKGGCTIGGQAILVNARSRAEADFLAGSGLEDSINALRVEETKYLDALAALARLDSVGAAERLEQSIKRGADRSDAFVADTEAIRCLRGDDVLLSAGGGEATKGNT